MLEKIKNLDMRAINRLRLTMLFVLLPFFVYSAIKSSFTPSFYLPAMTLLGLLIIAILEWINGYKKDALSDFAIIALFLTLHYFLTTIQ